MRCTRLACWTTESRRIAQWRKEKLQGINVSFGSTKRKLCANVAANLFNSNAKGNCLVEAGRRNGS